MAKTSEEIFIWLNGESRSQVGSVDSIVLMSMAREKGLAQFTGHITNSGFDDKRERGSDLIHPKYSVRIVLGNK